MHGVYLGDLLHNLLGLGTPDTTAFPVSLAEKMVRPIIVYLFVVFALRSADAHTSRAALFRCGATASSRSRISASAADSSAFAILRSSSPGTKRRDLICGRSGIA